MRTLHLPIADPCHEDWDAMDPQEQGRFCGKCTKQVHDLSTMTEDEANALLRTRAGSRICVRYEHDDAGVIRFRRSAALARTALAGVALAACTPHDNPKAESIKTSHDVLEPRPVLGEVAPVVAPVVEPVIAVKGEMKVEPPEPMHMLKGDVAVPNEPCDPPPVVKVVEEKPVVMHKRMGKPVMRRDDGDSI